MSCSFVDLIFNKPDIRARAALGLYVSLPSVSFARQFHPLRIRIINTKTNQPIPDERLNVALRTDQIGFVAMATNKIGIILVDYGKASIIRLLANMYADCRPRGGCYTNCPSKPSSRPESPPNNLCSDAKPKAHPGQLILF